MGCQPAPEPPERTELTVFAASSLTEVLHEIEASFERDQPNIDVRLVFSGSQVLRVQIEQGVRADVVALADQRHMRALVESGLARAAQTFAHNELAVIVPTKNPAGIHSFQDLPRATRIVLGAENVPIGAYTEALLVRSPTRYGTEFGAEIRRHIVSRESNVRLVRAKIEWNEADAAVVYRTDAVLSDRLRLIPIPAELNVPVSYPIAQLTGSAYPEKAAAFIAHVLSEEGQAALKAEGFLPREPEHD